jgi:hypothetical protein
MPRPAKPIKSKAKTVVRLRPANVLKHGVLKLETSVARFVQAHGPFSFIP